MDKKDFRILVVDDEKSLVLLASRILKKEGYSVQGAYSGQEALAIIKNFAPNLVISDLKMPEMSGIDLLKKVKADKPEIDFIILTAYASVENAVEAMKCGALDYLIKPLKNPDELRLAVEKVIERQALINSNTLWQSQLTDGLPPTNVIFAGMKDVWEQIQRVATTEATVLLQGESGTGKSLIAKVIHQLSGKKGAFVELNCAAMPETLIESELFGHEKGAFTGAVKTKQGKFELAQDGTIFLDEIGEMPLSAQAKLLRILQERAFERVGGTITLTTNARIVAATNQDLKARIKDKSFREDLYYRLSVFPIELPPLRKREGAIELIGTYLLQTIAIRVGKHVEKFSDDALELLKSYPWPGNIRELYNAIERAVILADEKQEMLTQKDLSFIDQSLADSDSQPGSGSSDGEELKKLEEIEREAIVKTLEKTKGHRKKAAEILGISLRTLQYKIKKYGYKKRQ
ncbi:MAG: sigma-54-dependent Fis family transcriptional regulator [Thermodesulfobacteria bacterium]|nr:sigma-54-dependent Fis family transcriptional regulator [Thermodesulfobacteriota bacterium]